ncbi:MAG: hypothetical protein K2M17_02390, partial [Bacilli bacterium]|nr:hypothetical protein [Bacilli bacterium]
MKKTNLIGVALTALIIAPTIANAATLPSPVDGKITMTEDIILDNKFLIASDTEIILDLNGHTLTGPTINYAIDNRGTLTIMDSAETKGSIVCPASTLSYDSSCVRNYKNMEINGVTINADWTAVKNEEK